MKSLMVLFAGCLLTMSAAAQSGPVENIEQKAQTIAQEIQYKGRNLSRDQRAEISRNLDSIRRILNGGSSLPLPPPPPMPPPPQSNYTCVSRDNDGANPYVFAIREGIQVTRIMTASFGTQTDCTNSLNSIRYVGPKNLLCLSRDNDGANPFVIASISGTTVSRITKTVSAGKQTCEDMLAGLRPDRNNNATFCISRDNDGAAPYVAASLSLYGENLQIGSESFSSVNACKAFLNQ